MKKLVLVVAALSTPLLAAEPAGIAVWSRAQLEGFGAKLAPKMNEKKLALEHLGNWGNHAALVAHRQADGEAEVHDTQTDFFVVQAGMATLVLGGEVVDGRNTAPGETRGPSIKGGTRHAIGAGDIAHIPAKVPHQLLIPAGKEFTYFVIKVNE